MKSILDPTFRYVNAASTDLKKTFARIRAQLRADAAARAAKVASIVGKKRDAA